MNFVVSRSELVRLINVKVSAPVDRPNTDGIHIAESTKIVMQSCRIGTGFSPMTSSSSLSVSVDSSTGYGSGSPTGGVKYSTLGWLVFAKTIKLVVVTIIANVTAKSAVCSKDTAKSKLIFIPN